MKTLLLKYGDVAAEMTSALEEQDSVGYEGGNRYVAGFLSATVGSDRRLLSFGERDAVAVAAGAAAHTMRLRKGRSALGRLVALGAAASRVMLELVRFGPDVIVCLDTGLPALTASLYCRARHAKLVIGATTDLVGTGAFFRWRERCARFVLSSGWTIAVLACTANSARQAVRLGRRELPVIIYYPDGFTNTCDVYVPVGKRDPNCVLFVGRLARVKGTRVLPDIAELTSRRPGTRVVVVGDGPDRGWIEREVARKGHGEGVRLIGTLDPRGVCDFMRTSRVVVVPSLAEGVAKVAIESASCGTPVVAFDVGGLPDTVIDGETGILVPRGDVGAFIDAVIRLLDEDELWARMSSNARVAWERLASREPKFARALGDVLRPILQESTQVPADAR